MANIKINAKHITINGKRVGVTYSAGPWVHGVNPDLIKIRPRRSAFPAEMRLAFSIENNSDSREDYFERDSIRILPDHPLYAQIKAVAIV
jgi:hypothetical protein